MAELTARTRFAAPLAESRAGSPSMSPSRRPRRLYPSADDIPYDISPSSILEAFTDGTLPPPGTSERKYLLCANGASLAQKATAIRAAKVALYARDWCLEIKHWSWPGTFDIPSGVQGVQEQLSETMPTETRSDEEASMEYWGSLPSVIVENYERRIEEIQDQMEKLDIEDLKSYIADLHCSRSRPTSSCDTRRTQLDLMDDFSLLITGILVQALPLLSQLSQSIETWSIRLSILHGVPVFARNLDEAQRALRLAWDAISLPSEADTSPASVSTWRNAVDTISLVLKAKISDLGRRVDGMLDSLEGREEVIPCAWIDDFEELEADYGRWVVEAQRRSLELDLRLINVLKTAVPPQIPLDPSDSLPSPTRSTSPLSDMLEKPGKFTAHTKSLTPEDSKRNSFDPSFTAASSAEIYEQNLGPPPSSVDGSQRDVSEKVRQRDADFEPTPAVVKRASITSIESFSRAQLKSITIRRNSSSSSILSANGHPRPESQEPKGVPSPINTESLDQSPHRRSSRASSPLEVTHEESPEAIADDFITPNDPRTPDRPTTLEAVSPSYLGASEPSSPGSPADDSPSVRQMHNLFNGMDEQPPPLNFAMLKRRAPHDEIRNALLQDEGEHDIDDNHTPGELQGQHSPTKSPTKSATADLNAQISDILTTVPANIRLTSSIDIDQPKAQPSPGHSGTQASQRLHASRSSVKSPELTLAPARPEEYPPHRRGGDPEIKVYHLIQPGQGKPIKLFIRTVGEHGERVMVRVGGGWADLGEYLRQYAEHHGRRTISEGKLEVLSSNGDTAASIASPGGLHVNKNPARGGTASPAGTPKQARDSSVSTPSNMTSGATATSTPDTNASTNSKGSWKGEEVGLAGPTAKKLDLSSEKREWIDSMMTQARRISGGMTTKSSNPDKEFGDLGKVGGTKRVWLRAPSRQS